MKSRGKSRLFVYNRYIRRKEIGMNSAKFYKVSYEQFQMGMEKEDVKDIYDAIKLPRQRKQSYSICFRLSNNYLSNS